MLHVGVLYFCWPRFWDIMVFAAFDVQKKIPLCAAWAGGLPVFWATSGDLQSLYGYYSSHASESADASPGELVAKVWLTGMRRGMKRGKAIKRYEQFCWQYSGMQVIDLRSLVFDFCLMLNDVGLPFFNMFEQIKCFFKIISEPSKHSSSLDESLEYLRFCVSTFCVVYHDFLFSYTLRLLIVTKHIILFLYLSLWYIMPSANRQRTSSDCTHCLFVSCRPVARRMKPVVESLAFLKPKRERFVRWCMDSSHLLI